MSKIRFARQTTSAPTEGLDTGSGSIMATMLARGVVVARQTAGGSFRPFGIEMDSADDATLVSQDPFIPPAD